jgi:hypothetical protein
MHAPLPTKTKPAPNSINAAPNPANANKPAPNTNAPTPVNINAPSANIAAPNITNPAAAANTEPISNPAIKLIANANGINATPNNATAIAPLIISPCAFPKI